jgi:hypothetical protein
VWGYIPVISTSSGHKTEHLPEAICEFNVLEPSNVSAGTQFKYSDFLGKDDHTYAKPWTDNQTTLTQTKVLCRIVGLIVTERFTSIF